MTPLLALFIILAVLIVILLIPLGIDGGIAGTKPDLSLRIAGLDFRVFPRKKKKAKPKKSKKPKKEQSKKEKQKKAKNPPDYKQLLGILKMGLRALSRFRRHLTINYVRLHFTYASDDPFKTALGYGYAAAVMGSISPLFEEAFNIRQRDYGVEVSFTEEKPKFDFWLTATIQIWELLYIGIAFGIEFLKMKIKEKKQIKSDTKNEQKTENGERKEQK